MVVLPLVAAPELMLNTKILIIIFGSICMWLTQPAFTFSETTDKKQSDKFTVILILLMSLVSVVFPIIDWAYFAKQHNNFNWLTILGIVMISSGIIFRAWAVQTLGKLFTPTVQIVEEHQLIKFGPYAVVRHPSYFGAFLTLVGGSVLLESIAGFIIAIAAMSIAYYVRISIEEKQLTKYFGEHYKQYMHETKMIIPFIW